MLKIPRVLTSLFPRPARTGGTLTREDHATLATIERWTSPVTEDPARGVSVHLVVGLSTWRFAAWALASWSHFAENGWPIRLHDDGSLPDEAAATLKRLFPSARLISRREADAALKPVLAAFPFCETLRDDDPAALRIFDALHFATAEHCISLDSHLLFFKFPREIVDWADGPGTDIWFNRDDTAQSLIKATEAADELGLTIREHVGDGVWLLTRSAFDLDFMDGALARTTILRGAIDDASRTIAMLCACRAGSGGLLPHSYDAAGARRPTDDEVCRHYPPPVRAHFVDEGIAWIEPHLFPAGEE